VKHNEEQREEKKKYLAERLVVALAAKLDLCECGGLIYLIDGIEYCGDCDNPRKYKE